MSKQSAGVKSFRDRWMAFVGVYDDLQDQSSIDHDQENTFVNAKLSLLERFQELRKSDLGQSMPHRLAHDFEALSGYNKISSLSDSQLKRLKLVIASITDELDAWLETRERKHSVLSFFARVRRREVVYTYFLIPIFFLALVLVFTFVGMRAFLTR